MESCFIVREHLSPSLNKETPILKMVPHGVCRIYLLRNIYVCDMCQNMIRRWHFGHWISGNPKKLDNNWYGQSWC